MSMTLTQPLNMASNAATSIGSAIGGVGSAITGGLGSAASAVIPSKAIPGLHNPKPSSASDPSHLAGLESSPSSASELQQPETKRDKMKRFLGLGSSKQKET
jgi:hypothetical protein